MELPPRVVSAMNAMNALGLSWEKTKPVLKNLLKIYEHNWDHIESENYRVLADAVLDSLELGVLFSFCFIYLVFVADLVVVCITSVLYFLIFQDRGFKKMRRDGGADKMNDVENGSFSGKSFKLGKDVCIGKRPSLEPPNNEHRRKASTAIINRPLGYKPQKLQNSISSTSRDKESSLHDKDKNALTNIGKRAQNSSIKIELASSNSGEVRLVILCDPALYHPNFQIPSMEVLCKMVEDRCLKSYKILEPHFSLTILLKEMCHCVMELSSKSSKEQGNIDMIQGMNLKVKYHSNNQTKRGKGTDETRSSGAITNGSLSLVVFQPQHSSSTTRTSVVCEADICRGQENLKISLANAPAKRYPPSFFYISRNIVYQNAYVNISLARIGDEDCCSTCSGDCLAGHVPCPCVRETGGDYAYTSDGLMKGEFLDAIVSMKHDRLKKHLYFCKDCPIERIRNEMMPEPCKGHLIRKFVKECWSKCGCNSICGNRLVQRGITRNLQVFWTSDGKGWGLRTLDELPKGAFICEYVGEILTNTELFDRQLLVTGKMRHTYPVLLDADWGSEQVLKDEEALCLDATFYGNVARFINHRCGDGNIVEVPVEIETPDHHYYHLAFFTVRNVKALEELTWDYGIDFDDQTHPIEAFSCRCGSILCRDRTQIRRDLP